MKPSSAKAPIPVRVSVASRSRVLDVHEQHRMVRQPHRRRRRPLAFRSGGERLEGEPVWRAGRRTVELCVLPRLTDFRERRLKKPYSRVRSARGDERKSWVAMPDEEAAYVIEDTKCLRQRSGWGRRSFVGTSQPAASRTARARSAGATKWQLGREQGALVDASPICKRLP